MSFFASVKKLFTKTKRKKESEKGVEMVGNIKPVYTRKLVGVSPKRQHRIMNSPPLRKKTNRRGRHPLGPLTPIESITTTSSTPQYISMSKSKSSSKTMSIPRSKSSSKSSSKTRTKTMSIPRSKSSSKSSSKTRSIPRSKTSSKSISPSPPLQIPKSSSYNSSTSNTRRKRQRGQRRYIHLNHTKHKIYRARLKTSPCRKIKPGAKCKLRIQCKYAMGNIRQFCRKRKNMRVRHYMG